MIQLMAWFNQERNAKRGAAMDYPDVEAVLGRLGLSKAVHAVPALPAVLIICVVVSYVSLPAISIFSGLQKPVLYLLIVVVGTVMALIGYFLGNFWDDRVFDPLYGLSGRWVDRETRPLSVFPAGDDLRRARGNAIRILLPDKPQGQGIYRKASEIARDKANWEIIEQPLILSKFLRAFIWPSALGSVFLIALGLWQTSVGDKGGAFSLGMGALLGVVFVLLFVPCINLRVEHMVRLYEHAAPSGPSR
jgi:hypothetical protein